MKWENMDQMEDSNLTPGIHVNVNQAVDQKPDKIRQTQFGREFTVFGQAAHGCQASSPTTLQNTPTALALTLSASAHHVQMNKTWWFF